MILAHEYDLWHIYPMCMCTQTKHTHAYLYAHLEGDRSSFVGERCREVRPLPMHDILKSSSLSCWAVGWYG
jgi:hypothetical protein